MRNLFIILGAAGLLGASVPMAHAAFSDDFSVGQPSASANGGPGFNTASTLMTSNGTRQLITYISANSAPGDARARTAVDNGAFTFSSDNEVTGIGYDVYSFSTPINLMATQAFQFTILSNDLMGSLYIGESDGSQTASVIVPLPIVAAGVPLVLTVPLNGGGVNTAAISNLEFRFIGSAGEDLSVDSIQAVPVLVPEPGSLALLGVAAAGAGLLIRRRRA